jgi:hypothetical protein
MKIFYMLFFAAFTSFFTSCTNDNDISEVTTGGWKVTLFNEDGKEKTTSFTGYIFDFQSTGVVTAIKGTEVVTGIWKELTDSGRTKFILTFSKSGLFEEISEDWNLVSKTDTSIKLTHTSGNAANIGVDILEFGK